MKYKLIGLFTCFVLAVSAMVFSTATADSKVERYHQHIENQGYTPCDDCEGLCSHLPLISIDTNGVEIPGKAILDPVTYERLGYTTAPDGSDVISATVAVIDNKEGNNHLNDKPTIETSMTIRVRGNSSREFEKSNYLMRFFNEDGTNNPQAFLGMDAHHEWALHGPYLDKSLIRNYICYNIAGEIMDYSPNVRFCEVVINGEYRGLYLATETITAGNNARLEISVDKKDNSFTGYIVRQDRGSKVQMKNLNNLSSYSRRNTQVIDIVYPGTKNLTPELAYSINEEFSAFEKALYSYDFDNDNYGYEEFIDVESFVDYFLINEFTCNYDAGWLSTYIYKDIDGKYRMCVWDFNSALDFYQESYQDPHQFEMQYCVWYVMLVKDRDFTERIVSRYKELREKVFSEEYLFGYIDDTVQYLGPAVERNYQVWGHTFEKQYDMLIPTERNPRNYKASVHQIKDFIKDRGHWLDENVEIINQYSAESKMKKYEENAN